MATACLPKRLCCTSIRLIFVRDRHRYWNQVRRQRHARRYITACDCRSSRYQIRDYARLDRRTSDLCLQGTSIHTYAGTTISNHDNSTPTGVQLFASSASLSSWVPTSSPTTLAKTSSLVPSSSATTFHTLLSCLPRLPHEQDMPVRK